MKNLCCLLFVLFPCIAFAQQTGAKIIDEVRVEGAERADIATVLQRLESKSGEPLSRSKVRDDIKSVYRTGFFEQVTVLLESKGAKNILIFKVVERPALRQVYLQGNDKVSDETLKEKLNMGTRRFLDRAKLIASIREAEKHYQSLGYFGTEIEFEVSPVRENQVDVTFIVSEGLKKKIRVIEFEGNEAFDDSELEDVIRTGEYSWLYSWLIGSGILKQELLDADEVLLKRHYLTNGYVDIVVDEPRVEQIEKGLKVVYRISEGAQYTIGELGVEGDLIDESEEKTLEGIELASGDVFNIDTLREDTFLISEKFTDIGYAFANVEPDYQLVRETQKVNLRFKVDKGEEVTVDRIEITGNNKTLDRVIRRSLKIQEQEQFSSSQIKESQRLLQRLGYFDEISITPEPTKEPDTVDLNVAVREANTGTFSIGAGVSSGDGFLITSRIQENNFLGRGYNVGFNVNTGTRNQNFILSFDNPRVYDTYWSFGVSGLSVEREFDDFDRSQTGGSIDLGYPLVFLGPEYLDDIRFNLQYELLKIDIDDVEDDAPQLILDNEGTSTSSSVTPRIVRNTIDNPLNPTLGSRQVLSVELAGIGGDEEFWLAEAQNTVYYPLFESGIGTFVFSQRTKFGWGETFNNEDFPLFRRFFPGGINSVRGFEARELGPTNEEGDEFGGNKQLILNFELILPLVDAIGLKLVGFYDIGNAFDDDENLEFSELREAVGWGLRWSSPLGPIRLEIGYPLDKEPGEDSSVLQFSFGTPL